MRKIVLCVLAGVLTALMTARALTPESARAASAPSDGEKYGYNICSVSLPVTTETAGSAMIAELNGYYLFRTPTARNALTGACAGKNLIVICAGRWRAPDEPGRTTDPALYRLRRGSASLGPVYATDWYQGQDGLLFAALTGVVPTTVDDRTALAWTGEQGTYFPYTPAKLLAEAGYACSAFAGEESGRAGLRALGFETAEAWDLTAWETLSEALEAEPFFAFLSWPEEDGGEALARLLDELKAARHMDDTVICLITGAAEDEKGHIYLYGLPSEAASKRPCSALDVTPTLLNLFGLPYDSRFLTGLDVFSTNSETGVVRAVTPLVSLYGSAYSDWVSDAGSYSSAGSIFRQTSDCFGSSEEVSAYVHDAARQVYDRYIYARKAMEMNYFRVVLD